MKIFSISLFDRVNCKTMCFNLGAILLGGFLLCSCSDDEKMEENLVGGRKLGWISEWVKAAKAMSLPMYD